jgi:hypothetical protein
MVLTSFRLQSTLTDLLLCSIDGLTLTPSKTGLLKETQHKFELLHFGFVVQWEGFRGVVISKQLLPRDDTLLPK